MRRPVLIGMMASALFSIGLSASAQNQPNPSSGASPAGRAEPGGAASESVSRTVERTAKNALYVEGLGAGILYSLNYDRAVGDVAFRLGASYLSVSAEDAASASFLTVPVGVSYLGLGSKTHIFELGAGATFVYTSAKADTVGLDASGLKPLGTLTMGYRLQPPDGGFLLRVGVSPIFGSGIFLPWPYLAVGATF